MGNTKQYIRNTNMELLRVLSMLFIVIGHYLYWGIFVKHGGDGNVCYGGGINWVLLESLRLLTSVAVDIYVMISGYFLIEKTTFRWKGIRNVWLTTFFYSVAITLVVVFLIGRDWNYMTIVEAFLPVTFAKYWFVQKYLGLMLLAPFLSRLALSISKREYQGLLAAMFFLFFKFPVRVPFNEGMVCSMSWFIFLYMFAGYVKIHGVPDKIKKNAGCIMSLLLMGLIVCTALINWVQYGSDVESYILYSTGPDGVIFLLAIPLFVLFERLQNNDSKFKTFVAKLAPYTFGVYLIHENRLLANEIWNGIMPFTSLGCNWVVVHCLLFSLCLFGLCVFVEFIRTKIAAFVFGGMK